MMNTKPSTLNLLTVVLFSLALLCNIFIFAYTRNALWAVVAVINSITVVLYLMMYRFNRRLGK